jgi:hypothetical protein
MGHLMIKFKKLAAAAVIAAALPAHAVDYDVIALTFEGLSSMGETVGVGNFYNGGASYDLVTGDPVNVGPTNFSIAFGTDGIAQALYAGGDAPWGATRFDAVSGDPIGNVGTGGLFLDEESFTINVPSGFNTAFSLLYATVAIGATSSVTVYDGLDGSGNVVGSFSLSQTPLCDPGTLGGQACKWAVGATGLSGTGRSVKFSIGGDVGDTFFDNITFGARTPTDTSIVRPPIPEPSTYALMALGLAGLSLVARRRR